MKDHRKHQETQQQIAMPINITKYSCDVARSAPVISSHQNLRTTEVTYNNFCAYNGVYYAILS